MVIFVIFLVYGVTEYIQKTLEGTLIYQPVDQTLIQSGIKKTHYRDVLTHKFIPGNRDEYLYLINRRRILIFHKSIQAGYILS